MGVKGYGSSPWLCRNICCVVLYLALGNLIYEMSVLNYN